jgi:hypothetical protein
MYQITTFLNDDDHKDIIENLKKNEFKIDAKKKGDGKYKLNIKSKFLPTVVGKDKANYEKEIPNGSVCDVVFSLKESTSGRRVLMILLEGIKVVEEGTEAASSREDVLKMLFD